MAMVAIGPVAVSAGVVAVAHGAEVAVAVLAAEAHRDHGKY